MSNEHNMPNKHNPTSKLTGNPSGPSAPTDALDRLRGFRVYPQRARGLGDDMLMQMKAMKKISQSESAANEAWETAAPDQLRDCATLGGLKAGKLILLVPSAAHRFQIDRWLASGGLGTIQSLARVPISGVQVKIDADASAPGS